MLWHIMCNKMSQLLEYNLGIEQILHYIRSIKPFTYFLTPLTQGG